MFKITYHHSQNNQEVVFTSSIEHTLCWNIIDFLVTHYLIVINDFNLYLLIQNIQMKIHDDNVISPKFKLKFLNENYDFKKNFADDCRSNNYCGRWLFRL